MIICKRVPLNPIADEVAAVIAGPTMNLMAAAKAANALPPEIIFGCEAMNKPTNIDIM